MDQFIEIAKTVIEKAPDYITAIVAVVVALTAFFSLIPGDQPEKTFKKITDLLSKFSRK